jgi:hypothetical protein
MEMLDDAREYLARVVPWPEPGRPGYVNIQWTFEPKDNSRPAKGGKLPWNGQAVTDMAGAVRAINYGQKVGKDLYVSMALAAQAEVRVGAKGFTWMRPLRLQSNAVGLRSFFIDIDLKDGPHGYPDMPQLAAALGDFIEKTGLPVPTILVSTGGGIHVYWVCDRIMFPEEWLPIAHSLNSAIRQLGLKCDSQCTVDTVRVLRIPDTFNYKYGVPQRVSLLRRPLEFDYSVERIRSCLQPYAVSHSTALSGTGFVDRSLFPPRAPVLGADELQSGVDDLYPSPSIDRVAPACGFLADALATGGAAYSNPLWNITTLISVFTEGGRVDAHRMADKHAQYTAGETDALFDRKSREKHERGLGWPSCNAIAAAGATACNTCALRTAGKSPLNYEQRSTAPAAGPGIATSAPAGNSGPTVVATGFGQAAASSYQAPLQGPPPAPINNSDMPPGYSRDASGCIVHYIDDPGNPGQKIAVRINDYPMMDAWLQRDPMVLHFQSVVSRTSGAQTVTQIDLPLEVAATNEMRKVLQGQGFMLPAGDRHAGDFFVAWISQLQKIKDTVSSSSFGWLNRAGSIDGFVYGDRLWTPNGDEPAAPANQVLAQRYRPKGTDAFWLDATKLVCGCGRPDLEALVASAFAAPLMQFTGHRGTLMSAYSRESGIGKSTAIAIAQSVWGNPVKGVQGLTDTENATMGIVGELKSLPLYWDELKTEADTKKFVKMTFQISSGKGKSRMNSRAELREPGDWQTLVISASNESLIDHVVSHTTTTTAGLMRIFEYNVQAIPLSKSGVSTSEATIRLAKLNNNFGHVGLKYAQFLGANHGQIAVEMSQLAAALEAEVAADQEERFWIATISCILLGARYAAQIGYPVFNYSNLKKFLVHALQNMRLHRNTQTVDLDKSINVSAVLNRFFNDVKKNGSWLVTNRIHVGQGKPPKNSVSLVQPADGNKLNGIDVQVGIQNSLLRISSATLGAWCKKNEINKINLLEAMARSMTITSVKNARMGAGTNWSGTNEHIIEIDITSSTDLDFIQDLV